MNKLLFCLVMLVALASAIKIRTNLREEDDDDEPNIKDTTILQQDVDLSGLFSSFNSQGFGSINQNQYNTFQSSTRTSGASTLQSSVSSGYNIGGFNHCKLSLNLTHEHLN